MQLSFDASNHKPMSFELIPDGWQNMCLVEGEEKPTSKGNGDTYYAAVFEIIDGKYSGRKLFHNFNFNNSNEDAKRIAYDQLAAIMHAVGVLKITRMEELFNKPIAGKVKIRPAVMEDDGKGGKYEKYEARNELKGFKPVEGPSVAGAVSGGSSIPAGFGNQAQSAIPEGFTSQAQASPAPAQASPAASAPSAPAPAAPAPAPTRKLVMTAKAGGGTAEQFRAHDPAWTDDLLVQEGYAEWVIVEPEKPAAPAAPVAPAPAAAVAQTQAAAPAADDDTPPWLKEQ